MVGDSHGTARCAAVTDRNVLVKGRGTLDRGLVDTLVLPDGVSSTIRRNGTLL